MHVAVHGPNRLTWSQFARRVWLAGLFALLPVDLAVLPLNVDLADCWIIMGLPILWMSFLRGQRIIALSYAIPMWLILMASVASTFVAVEPLLSIVVIVKEVFLFALFFTMAVVFHQLAPDDMRFVLTVWLVAALLHGCLIVAQLLNPGIWRITAALAGRSTAHIHYRPTGMFANANKAAVHQLFGYVPLLLLNPSRKTTMVLGVALVPTIIATGSMGATLAFAAGLAIALVAAALSGRLAQLIQVLARLALVLLLIGGLAAAVIGTNARAQEHLARILLGRTDRSSESRFSLWERGANAYVEHNVFLWGIGPENFRVVDGAGNQLHNDLVAFTVERGLLGALGFLILFGLALSRAITMIRLYLANPNGAHLSVVVFLAAVVATLVESLTHQMFHIHEVWLVLALQEATLLTMTSKSESLPEAQWTTAAVTRARRGRLEEGWNPPCRSS